MSDTPDAFIIITTKDRKDELRAAVASCLTQSVPVEVLVFDDGSTDGTSDMVRAEFPTVHIERVEQSLGIIAARNRAMTLITSPIVFTIDDDCVFNSSRTVEQTLGEFDDPRVGAVSIPMINILQNQRVLNQAPDNEHVYVTGAFVGCAHALRRSLFVQLGRYREFLWRQGEESDYCIRLLNAGYVVRMGRADPIHHMAQPTSVRPVVQFYSARTAILYVWWNVPMPYMPIHLAKTTLNVLLLAVRQPSSWPSFKGLAKGYVGCLRQLRQRCPVTIRTYRLLRKINRTKYLRLDLIETNLALAAKTAGTTA